MVTVKPNTLSTMVDYWERLSEALKYAGVTVKQLQDHLSVSYQAMKKLEDGKTKSLTAENNAKAARYLGVDSYWLATGQGEKVKAMGTHTATEPIGIYKVIQWPFEAVTPDQYDRLGERQKGMVEGYVRGLLESAPESQKQEKRAA